jgi:hypothetical protein
VVSVEADPVWFARLGREKPPNVSLCLVKNDLSDVEQYLAGRFSDVIVIDGLDRYRCAERSLNRMAPNGAIILDDSQRHYGPTTNQGQGCIGLFREAGWRRIDFYGYSPGNSLQHCTSLFFQKECFLLSGDEDPALTLSFWSTS